ncbi:HET-domain-containing protein [Cadophora sp. DSE1049]|nr:HET-domain-containing protein [Cadophora sp. DSE1049]
MSLSHSWGPNPFLELRTHNLESFKKSTPFDRLTKTFQDATVITREMGIEYLWIDSLCIIQKDPVDWAKESSIMGDVYANSYCNIAATHAVDGSVACFSERRDIDISGLIISIPKRRGHKVSVFKSCHYAFRDKDLWENEITNSPLLKRAWVYQERVLSPRILHFTERRLFFECQQTRTGECFRSELEPAQQEKDDVWNLGDGMKEGLFAMLHEARSIEPVDEDAVFRRRLIAGVAWTYMVNNYSTCDLTRESDRLVAIAGLAGALQPLMDCRYLAGIWEDNIVPQLLWFREPGEYNPLYSKPMQPPSWSWASRPGKVVLMDKRVYEIGKLLQFTPDERAEASNTQPLIRILDMHVINRGENSMGEVISGCLKIRGRLVPLLLNPRTVLKKSAEFAVRGVQFDIFPDNPTMPEDSDSDTGSDTDSNSDNGVDGAGSYARRMAAGQSSRQYDRSGRNTELESFVCAPFDVTRNPGTRHDSLRGLLLKRVGRERGQYERVGHIMTSEKIASIAWFCNPFQRDKHESRLITSDLYQSCDTIGDLCTYTIV